MAIKEITGPEYENFSAAQEHLQAMQQEHTENKKTFGGKIKNLQLGVNIKWLSRDIKSGTQYIENKLQAIDALFSDIGGVDQLNDNLKDKLSKLAQKLQAMGVPLPESLQTFLNPTGNQFDQSPPSLSPISTSKNIGSNFSLQQNGAQTHSNVNFLTPSHQDPTLLLNAFSSQEQNQLNNPLSMPASNPSDINDGSSSTLSRRKMPEDNNSIELSRSGGPPSSQAASRYSSKSSVRSSQNAEESNHNVATSPTQPTSPFLARSLSSIAKKSLETADFIENSDSTRVGDAEGDDEASSGNSTPAGRSLSSSFKLPAGVALGGAEVAPANRVSNSSSVDSSASSHPETVAQRQNSPEPGSLSVQSSMPSLTDSDVSTPTNSARDFYKSAVVVPKKPDTPLSIYDAS